MRVLDLRFMRQDAMLLPDMFFFFFFTFWQLFSHGTLSFLIEKDFKASAHPLQWPGTFVFITYGVKTQVKK